MPKHILVAHDLSPEADRALQRAADLARRLEARLTLLHVGVPGADAEPARQLLAARLAGEALPRAELHLRHGQPAEQILAQARGLEADLLVLGSHHRDSPEGFAGTTLEQVLHASPAPVLLAVSSEPAPWRRALAALDFSPCASRALRLAAALLGAEAELHALHVHEVAAIHAGEDAADLAFQGELFDALMDKERAALPPGHPRLSHELRQGERGACLQAVFAERGPQLLALGAHSRSLLAEALLGSLTRELLEQPPCDVLVAR